MCAGQLRRKINLQRSSDPEYRYRFWTHIIYPIVKVTQVTTCGGACCYIAVMMGWRRFSRRKLYFIGQFINADRHNIILFSRGPLLGFNEQSVYLCTCSARSRTSRIAMQTAPRVRTPLQRRGAFSTVTALHDSGTGTVPERIGFGTGTLWILGTEISPEPIPFF